MIRRRRRKTFLLVLGLLALLIGLPAWTVYREYRQQRLNHSLIVAAIALDADSITTLLAQGADPNAREAPDVPHSFWQVLRQMLEGRHIQYAVQEPGDPAVYLALQSALDLISQIHADDTTDDCIIQKKIEPAIKALIEQGADVRSPTIQNKAILYWVSNRGSASTLKLLLDHGADPNGWQQPGKASDIPSPLGNAAVSGNIENVRLLLERGADVNMRDTYNNSILSRSEYNATNRHFTPSRRQPYKTIVALLKQAGAK